MSILRSKLLNIQQTAYRRNQKIIHESLTHHAFLSRYANEYLKNLKSFEAISSKHELIRRILTSDVVYHGDYHSLRQSQRSVFRILRDIIDKRSIILCLEMFYGKDQRFIDDYMNNRISQRFLLKKINYNTSWGYNWNNWKPVIELCKKNKIPILGINSKQSNRYKSLYLRDVYSAKIISKTIIQHPKSLVYVVDGDYHIAPKHLPYHVETFLSLFDIDTKRTIIYQNVEAIYWQLAELYKEDADVIQIISDSFCIMNTTPANKLQSYINWLDYSEDAYYPVQAGWGEPLEKSGNTSIPELSRTMCTILGMPFPEKTMDHLAIYYGANLDFFESFENIGQCSKIIPRMQQKIKLNEGFLLEYENHGVISYLVYLPISSLNMAAEESAHLLHAIFRGSVRENLKPFDTFYSIVMTEAIGFFGSKLINEKRKALTQHAIRQYVGSFKKKKPSKDDKRKITLSRLLLQHCYKEAISNDPNDFNTKFAPIFRTHSNQTHEFATQLGYMLGDKLFSAVKKGRYPLEEIVKLFHMKFSKPYEAFFTYLSINHRVRKKT